MLRSFFPILPVSCTCVGQSSLSTTQRRDRSRAHEVLVSRIHAHHMRMLHAQSLAAAAFSCGLRSTGRRSDFFRSTASAAANMLSRSCKRSHKYAGPLWAWIKSTSSSDHLAIACVDHVCLFVLFCAGRGGALLLQSLHSFVLYLARGRMFLCDGHSITSAITDAA